MKKLLIFLISLFLIILTSCSNKNDKPTVVLTENVHLFSGELSIVNNVSYYFKAEEKTRIEENNHLLLEATLQITSPISLELETKNFTLIGNDRELIYPVYFDNDINKISLSRTKDTTFSIEANEPFSFTVSTIIPHGNMDALFSIKFKVGSNSISLDFFNNETYHSFSYVHDPRLNSSCMADIEEDVFSVYGFSPKETGNLKEYIEFDFSDDVKVAQWTTERINYHQTNNVAIKALEQQLRYQNKTIEEIARACSELRNQIRIESYNNNLEGLNKLYQRNLEKYGRKEGPTPEFLYEKYGSWEIVLAKSYSINSGMDAILGLYDMYFDYYGIQ